jgi:hypothetical protein
MLASRAPLAHAFHDLGGSADLAEGTAAFRERRPARFQGK